MNIKISDMLSADVEGHKFTLEILLCNGDWLPCPPLTDSQVAHLGQLCDTYLKKEGK